jgi:hypothetical protein
MEIKQEYLVKRRNIYYFRWRIPKKLASTLKASEIKCSLQTKDLKKAQNTCKLIVKYIQDTLGQKNNMKLEIEEIRKVLANLVKKSLDSHEKHLAVFGPICTGSKEDGIIHCNNVIRLAKEALQNNNLDFLTAKGMVAEELAENTYDDEDIAVGAREYIKLLIYVNQIKKLRLEGDYENEYDSINLKEFLSGRYLQPSPSEVVLRTPDTNISDVNTLSQLIQKYIAEKISAGAWQDSMKISTEQILNMFLEVIGDIDITAIRHQDVLEFRNNILMKLPRQVGNRNKKYGQSIRQIANSTKKGDEVQSTKTINIKMEKIASFFNWCMQHEYIERHPAKTWLLNSNIERVKSANLMIVMTLS